MRDFRNGDDVGMSPAADGANAGVQHPLEGSERRAFVDRWIRANRKRAAAGLGLVALTLPFLASAQTDDFVNVGEISGVSGVTVGPDGAATLTLDSGQTVVVPASQVRTVGDAVFISASAAEIVAGAVAAAPAVATGAIAGAVGAAAVGVAAASSSSGGTRPEPAPLVGIDTLPGGGVVTASLLQQDITVSGTATNAGPGSVVVLTLLDADGNMLAGTEPVEVAVQGGRWSLTIPKEELEGIDVPEGAYTLRAELRDADGAPLVTSSEGVTVDFTEDDTQDPDPTEPEDPEDPAEPEDPEDPTEPEDPEDPAEPEDPEDPAEPEDPEDPTEPEDPAEPEPQPGPDYVAARTFLTEVGRDGSSLTLAIELDPRFELPADGGFNVGETVSFDTDVVTFASAPAPVFGIGLIGIPNLAKADEGEITLGGIGIGVQPGVTPVRFTMNVEDAAQVARLDVASDAGGPYTALIGTDASDSLVAGDVDTTLRGRGGDDQIDLSAPAVHTVFFEPTMAENGTDTVTGFSLAGTSEVPDRIGLADLDTQNIRGREFEIMDSDSLQALGSNTGFLVFTTAFAGDDAQAVLDVIAALDLGANEVLYVLASDGEVASLARLVMDADGNPPADPDQIDDLARFEGVGDLTGFGAANILGFSPLSE